MGELIELAGDALAVALEAVPLRLTGVPILGIPVELEAGLLPVASGIAAPSPVDSVATNFCTHSLAVAPVRQQRVSLTSGPE